MNKKQKITLITGFSLVILLFLYWIISSGEIFTKTSVLVERKDELFGTTYMELIDKFVLGLDYTLAASGVIIIISAIFFFIYKNKTKGEK